MITRDLEGQIRFHSVEDEGEVTSALKEIFNSTDVGRDYKTNYYTKQTGDDDYGKADQGRNSNCRQRDDLGRNLTHALTLLIDSGEIKRRDFVKATQLAEPEEDTRPRGRDGKPLTDAQLKWQEYRTWSETASSSEVSRRKQSDPGYAAYVRKALQAEMSQPIGDAVTPAGDPEKKSKANTELLDFVQKYNRTPSDALKPRGGYVKLDGQLLLHSTYLSLVERLRKHGYCKRIVLNGL